MLIGSQSVGKPVHFATISVGPFPSGPRLVILIAADPRRIAERSCPAAALLTMSGFVKACGATWQPPGRFRSRGPARRGGIGRGFRPRSALEGAHQLFEFRSPSVPSKVLGLLRRGDGPRPMRLRAGGSTPIHTHGLRPLRHWPKRQLELSSPVSRFEVPLTLTLSEIVQAAALVGSVRGL
jgi:hypothetical protein